MVRFKVIDSLLRERTFHQIDSPSLNGPQARIGSPTYVLYILITRAPKYDRLLVVVPPATILLRSITVMPFRGPGFIITPMICYAVQAP